MYLIVVEVSMWTLECATRSRCRSPTQSVATTSKDYRGLSSESWGHRSVSKFADKAMFVAIPQIFSIVCTSPQLERKYLLVSPWEFGFQHPCAISKAWHLYFLHFRHWDQGSGFLNGIDAITRLVLDAVNFCLGQQMLSTSPVPDDRNRIRGSCDIALRLYLLCYALLSVPHLAHRFSFPQAVPRTSCSNCSDDLAEGKSGITWTYGSGNGSARVPLGSTG